MSDRIGTTGRMHGTPTRPGDQGGLVIAITAELGKVAIDCSLPVRWIYMLPDEAREFARVLCLTADEAEGKS